MTLQSSLLYLNQLAGEYNAKITTSIQLEFGGGALLTVFFEDGPATVPLECSLWFGRVDYPDNTSSPDALVRATVQDHKRFLWALDEGLEMDEAKRISTLEVVSFEEVVNYLLGKSYRTYLTKTANHKK